MIRPRQVDCTIWLLCAGFLIILQAWRLTPFIPFEVQSAICVRSGLRGTRNRTLGRATMGRGVRTLIKRPLSIMIISGQWVPLRVQGTA